MSIYESRLLMGVSLLLYNMFFENEVFEFLDLKESYRDSIQDLSLA